MRFIRIIFAAVIVVCFSFTDAGLTQDDSKFTSENLWQAARAGDVAAIEKILSSGVDVNSKTAYGGTALAFAAERGKLDAVKLLIEKGADVNSQDDFYHASPWTWASLGGHKEVAQWIKDKGGKPAFDMGDNAASKNPDSAAPAEAEPAAPSEKPESIAADQAFVSANWPQFRGTAARGLADGQHCPLKWSVETNENVAWKTRIPGLGHSCPVIWGNRVFVTSAVCPTADTKIRTGNYGDYDSVEETAPHQFVVYAVDLDSGAIVWEKIAIEEIPQVKRHLKSTHANSTCATDGKFLVAFFGSEGLFCYDFDGNLLWKKDLGFLDSGWFYDADYQWGFGSSPVIHGGVVYVQCDIQTNSFIAAFRLADGSEIWRQQRDEIPSWSTPTVYDTSDGPVIVANGTKKIRAYDARDGREIWSLGNNSEVVVPTPQFAYQTIFVTSGYKPIQPIYAVSMDARGDVTLGKDVLSSEGVRWAVPRYGPYLPTPLVYGGYLYTLQNSGIFSCFDAATGKQLYRERLKGFGSISFVASLVAADGHIFATSEDGQVIVLKAGPTFEALHANPTGESVLSTPAIAANTFVIRGQEHLIAIRQK